MKQCMAFRHVTPHGKLLSGRTRSREGLAVLLLPCRRPIEGNSRFCREHEQAYREILFGILEEAGNIPHRK